MATVLAASVAVHFLVETRAQAWLRPRLERWAALLPLARPKRAAAAPLASSATS